ncbi:MAG: hypothetical protein CMM52_15340 [Rhodospirillaceae bacterium]|nr:hypothetical protein [Rhodospirillaceae bacterium]
MSNVSSIREELRDAMRTVAKHTQYVRENLHKPFNGSTKFVTVATVTGLGAFYALIDQAIINPIENSFEKDIAALKHEIDEHKKSEAHTVAGKLIVKLQGANIEQERQIIALCRILAQRLSTLEHKNGGMVHEKSCDVLSAVPQK